MRYPNYKKFLPVNDSKSLIETDYGSLSPDDLLRWKNFKGNITRTPFMLGLLLSKQNNTCPLCGSSLTISHSVIHHFDYKNLCHFTKSLKILRPTPSNPNRKVSIAPCENCHDTSACERCIVLIHRACHIYVHAKEGRIHVRKKKTNDSRQLRLFGIDT